MKTKLCLCLLLLAAACQARAAELLTSSDSLTKTSTAPSKTIAPPRGPIWPQDTSDLKTDPNVVWGRLDNGLRYAILPTRALPGHVAMRLYMNAGSLMETEQQRGIAHFLEHMAFNGTKNFPAGELVKYFQHLGMTFGPHANAYTSYDRTVYMLELQRAEPELLRDGLMVFRDTLDGMLLEPAQIDRERRVIFSEILARNTVGSRAIDAGLRFLEPDARMPLRDPVGLVATVGRLKQTQFVEFYHTWYTPGRATIVATGDLNVRQIEGMIREEFADAKAQLGELPTPSFGKVLPIDGPVAGFHSESDAAATSVELCVAAPAPAGSETSATDRLGVVRGLLNTMLNERLEKIAAAKDAPFQVAGMSHGITCGLVELHSIAASCQPAKWQLALASLEQELRRASEFGFTDAEFAHARSVLFAAFQSDADQAETRSPSDLADQLVGSLADRRVFTVPAQDLIFAKSTLSTLTKEDCRAALQSIWNPRQIRIWVHGNVQLAGDPAAQILAAYRSSQAVVVSPIQNEQASKLTLVDLGPAGKVVARKQVTDLDFTQATLSNNVRVNIKRTKLEKNEIYVRVRFGGGAYEEPADKPGLGLFTTITFQRGGLRSMTAQQLDQAIADKDMALGFAVDDNAFQFRGSCSPKLLETELNLCAAFIAEPAFRDDGRDRLLGGIDSFYAQFENSAEGVLISRAQPFLHGNDERFQFPPREVLTKLTMKDVERWLAKPLRSGYMEVAIVGDVDVDQGLQLTAKTLGALPEREAVKPAFADRQKIKFPASPKLKEFRFDSPAPRAVSMVCWPTAGSRDASLSRRIGVLSAVLSNRIFFKVRQELGATYSPDVEPYAVDAFPDYGYITAQLTVEPKKAVEIGPLVAKIGADLAAGSISDDEFERAIKPIVRSYDTLYNGYWLNLLTDCQTSPACLDSARRLKADYASITKAEIQQLAKQYFAAGKATVINAVPK